MESRQGLIIDHRLHRENISDSKLVEPSIKRISGQMKLSLKKLRADRGMFSRSNEALLRAHGIQSGLCPRNPTELKERLADPAQREGMKRRGSTEERVAIFKNVILGNPVRGKSIQAREQTCGWGVLGHNLWVLARMPQTEQAEARGKKARQASQGRQRADRPEERRAV